MTMTLTVEARIEARNEVLATLAANMARYEACIDNSWILAWPHSLAVGMKHGETFVTGIDTAFGFHDFQHAYHWGRGSNIRNGRNERPVPMRRQQALAIAKAELLKTIAFVEAMDIA